MLLLHQTGSVKIGEVLRYTVTYTPANDRILPAPTHLFLKIKNTSTVALRAAFIHGPYTLYVSSAPSNFRPNVKCENPRRDGVPEFEPNLKAGGTWYSKLSIPEDPRRSAGSAQSRDDGLQKSMTWVIEVASQVIFSTSASVHYEILIGRDEKSLSLGFMGGNSHGIPGQVSDHQQSQGAKDGSHAAQPKGVYSKAIKIKVEDTATLWNTPRMPEWDDENKGKAKEANADAPTQNADSQGPDQEDQEDPPDVRQGRRQKNVHLVILTHGLHSNLGADMLYMKESIDEATKQAKLDRRERRKRRSTIPGDEAKSPAEHIQDGTEDSEDEEEVIVRGFSGNAVRTEKGIKYLGKRLAKYVLQMTYPDQPFKPISKSAAKSMAMAMKHEKDEHGLPIHHNSSIREEPFTDRKLAYKITSISFIAHSLGGLIQTYAVAYVQKHSPHFFDLIKPINFIALATPFLGLSNENPLYVKFALDFGLVGRTGQDLGLTWRAPTIAKSGWSALVGGIGESAHKKLEAEKDPGAKPVLRILPTGPAHLALKKFRNRTVYSNVVNDGIVPLRTSCLLFLDWSGLDRVEKARRENGLVGTMAGWGWAELTGANASHARPYWSDDQETQDKEGKHDETGPKTLTREGKGDEVPQPADNATDFDVRSIRSLHNPGDKSNHASHRTELADRSGGSMSGSSGGSGDETEETSNASGTVHNAGALDGLLGFFKSNPAPKSHKHIPKHTKIYKRSQTLKVSTDGSIDDGKGGARSRSPATTGEEDGSQSLSAPPKTTFFEAAGDLLAPPIVPAAFLIDPASRPRTIFHDRVYHPEDIPPPPLKRRSTSMLQRARKPSTTSDLGHPPSLGSHSSSSLQVEDDHVVDDSAMKVEEKIARAYHRDLSWRKVLVRLEPDAHNNMIVRRKFANAYGWPVIKHLVDIHFSDSVEAKTADDEEGNQENAKAADEQTGSTGNETHTQERHEARSREGDSTKQAEHSNPRLKELAHHHRSDSEVRESKDSVPALNSMRPGNLARVLDAANSSADGNRPIYRYRQDSATWSDGDFADSDDESDADNSTPHPKSPATKRASGGGGWNWTEAIAGKGVASPKGTKSAEINDFLTIPNPAVVKDGKNSIDTSSGPRPVASSLASTETADSIKKASTEDVIAGDAHKGI